MEIRKRIKKLRKEWHESVEFCTADCNSTEGRRRVVDYANAYEKYKVKNNYVLYESFYGRGVIDNPYALFCELLNNKSYKNFQHFWVIDDFDDIKDILAQYKSLKNVHFIKIYSQEYFRALSECKYLINNNTFPTYFTKKKDQVYVNTWHGTPLKSIGYEMEDGREGSSNIVRNFLNCDYLLSANDIMTNMYLESYMLQGIFTGEILEEGYPRNDTIKKASKADVLKQLAYYGIKIDENKKIILYAPTWKQKDTRNAEVNPDELLDVKEELEKNIDTNKYQILIKPHSLVYKHLQGNEAYKGLLIPSTIDANALICIVDIMISDYSSIFMDFLITGRPVLFYMPNLESYKQERGINFSVDSLPGPYTDNIDEIAEYINNIKSVEEKYKTLYKHWQQSVCGYDDGQVSARIVDIIFSGGRQKYHKVKANLSKKKLLIAVAALSENGIIRSFLNLLNYIDYEEWDVTVYVTVYKNDQEMHQKLEKINPKARVLVKCGHCLATLNEEIRKDFCTKEGLYHNVWDRLYPWDMMNREFIRTFGYSEFDYIIEYEGYNRTIVPMLLCGKAKSRSIWLHNDMQADMNKVVNGEKKNWEMLHFVISLYPRYDHLVSCSKAVMEVNRENLSTPETYNKFTYANNLIDVDRIKTGLKNEITIDLNNKDYLVKMSKGVRTSFDELEMVELPKNDCINFVTMGRMSTEKNHITLIRAFTRFHKDHVNSHLFIMGDGPLREKIEKVIKNLQMNDHITLTGNIDNPFAIMKRCNCFIFPSLHEGLPLVLLEARACGLPIIVSDFSTVKDSLYPNGQLLIKSDEESIYEGLCAFVNGQVPVANFNLDEKNRESYEEFLKAIM